MEKPEFIKKQELGELVYSEMNFFTFENEIYKFFENKETIKRVYEKSKIDINGLARWDEIIYQTQHPFFIYIKNNSVASPQWNMVIYYSNPEKINELIIFVRQLLKKLKDETINDGATA